MRSCLRRAWLAPSIPEEMTPSVRACLGTTPKDALTRISNSDECRTTWQWAAAGSIGTDPSLVSSRELNGTEVSTWCRWSDYRKCVRGFGSDVSVREFFELAAREQGVSHCPRGIERGVQAPTGTRRATPLATGFARASKPTMDGRFYQQRVEKPSPKRISFKMYAYDSTAATGQNWPT